ncbi:MAG: DNA (cytosine-5-)-methyltransferase, partial [Muribaculum sp.]|nr:DNA (cytosine-5-)-methyltransferase [Muribaculum sp.]
MHNIRLVDFPEKIDNVSGIKIYGEASLETQMAIMSHYLHNEELLSNPEARKKLYNAIMDYLDSKKDNSGLASELSVSDLQVDRVSETLVQYGLFDDFFKVPYPNPKEYKFTFIDLFAGMGGFR